MTWSIDPVSARAVCETTRGNAGRLDEVATDLANAFGDAQAAVADGAETSKALAELAADPFLIRLSGMRRHVGTVTETTEDVIDLYVAHDLEMAAETQSTMHGLLP